MTRMCLVLVAFLCSATSLADEVAERRQLAADLLGALNMEATITKSFDMVKAMVPAQLAQMQKTIPGMADARKNFPPDKLKAHMDKVMALVAEEMSWEKMKDDFVNLYADTFSADKLKALVAFYSTPAGKAFVEKQPELMRRSMEMSQKAMFRVLPKMIALQTELMKEEAGKQQAENPK